MNVLKKLYESVFLQGQETVAKKVATEFFLEKNEMDARVGVAANDAIDLANRIAADGDPHKQRLAELLKDKVVQSYETMNQVELGRVLPEEAGAAGQAVPFSSSSNGSTASLPSTSPKALEDETQTPPKAKRGRPRKKG